MRLMVALVATTPTSDYYYIFFYTSAGEIYCRFKSSGLQVNMLSGRLPRINSIMEIQEKKPIYFFYINYNYSDLTQKKF